MFLCQNIPKLQLENSSCKTINDVNIMNLVQIHKRIREIRKSNIGEFFCLDSLANISAGKFKPNFMGNVVNL